MRTDIKWLWLGMGGLIAGFINGMLGAGGGIIVIFVLTRMLGDSITEKNAVFAHALCVMLPLSLLTCILYGARGHMTLEGFGVFALPAILGGLCGGALLGRLGDRAMRRGFAGLVIISGILLMVR